MMDWKDITMSGFIFLLGIAMLITSFSINQNSNRIDVLSKRIFNLEQQMEKGK